MSLSLREQLPPTLLESLGRNVKSLGFIGVDFLEDPKLRLPYFFRYSAFVALLLLFFTGQIFYFIKIKEIGVNLVDISNAVPCILLVVQNLIKLRIVIIKKRKLLTQIVVDIAEIWPTHIEENEKQDIMNDWLRQLKMFNDAVFRCTTLGLLGFTAIPFVLSVMCWYGDGADRYLHIFQLYLPFPINSKWFYCLVYIIEAFSGCVIYVCLHQGCDLLICSLVIDVCMLMRLLQYDLENIEVLEKDVYGRHDPVKAEECYQAAKQVAKTHQKLLRICEKINELYGGNIFSMMCFSSFMLCFFGFLTIVFAKVKILLLRNFLAFAEVMFIVFCICLPGQILQDTSSGIADAAYQSLWYASDLKFRKMIVIILARSQKPCHLSALGFAHMNFNGLCKICSSAWSYLSLLNQMFGDTDFQL